MIELTKENWNQILQINWKWNQRIMYQDDLETYGKSECWSFPNNFRGDCEDYAIAKRQSLLDINIPSFFAVCRVKNDPKRELHAVLIVRSNRGDFVLDNRNKRVRAFSDTLTEYEWIKIEGENGKWYDIV